MALQVVGVLCFELCECGFIQDVSRSLKSSTVVSWASMISAETGPLKVRQELARELSLLNCFGSQNHRCLDYMCRAEPLGSFTQQFQPAEGKVGSQKDPMTWPRSIRYSEPRYPGLQSCLPLSSSWEGFIFTEDTAWLQFRAKKKLIWLVSASVLSHSRFSHRT